MADYTITKHYMQKLKWGDLPLGAIVYVNGHPHHIVNITKRGVCVLDLYHNKLTRRRASTQAIITTHNNI